MEFDVMDPVVWPDDDPDRQQWWASVLGSGSTGTECETADLIEQHREVVFDDVVFDDDGYPPTAHSAPAAAAAA
ncbi:hypothetical protein CH299_27700 [Rhodococcus sp. 14-2686-1-2]|nr:MULTISPECIES: hypothetical protein [unclassified Rhodococcus (in: high G+C Gram-positive bacteria)]OZE93553.1 hypothetical protein CH301_27180 [Rhodococcus sp. 15-1189-1-1a]OZF08479.1 hypothetical protein CH299_27700 [Rhodococcus sp. 14-2686-1-2]